MKLALAIIGVAGNNGLSYIVSVVLAAEVTSYGSAVAWNLFVIVAYIPFFDTVH